jgi:hypothetical protein
MVASALLEVCTRLTRSQTSQSQNMAEPSRGGFRLPFSLQRRGKSRKVESSSLGSLGLETLFDPSGSIAVDLLFVHGLNGGSQSTWTKGLDSTLFWPQEWLPHDDSFQDVRIHTFGYDSNLGKGSILDIQDFAKSLLGSIQHSPTMSHSSNVSIVGFMITFFLPHCSFKFGLWHNIVLTYRYLFLTIVGKLEY